MEHKEAKNNQLEQEEKRIHIAMVACGGVNPASKGLQYVEYSLPSTKRLDVEMDQGLPRSLIAVGLGVAAFAFAGKITEGYISMNVVKYFQIAPIVIISRLLVF